MHGAFGELCAQIAGELTVVQFADDDFLVFAQDVAGVLGQGANVIEMGVGNLFAFVVHFFNGQGDSTCGATPTDDEQVAVGVAGDFLVGDVVGNAVDFLLTVVGHEGMVFGVGAERAVGAFLKTADTVAQAFHSGESPFASEGFWVAAERTVVGVVGLGQTRGDGGEVGDFGDTEQLRTIAEVTIGEEDDGSHVLEGEFGGGVGPVEAVGAA